MKDDTVRLEIESDCQKVAAYAAGFGPVNAIEEPGRRHDATVLLAARDPRYGACAGCVAAAGIHRATPVAAGLALPADTCVRIVLEDST